MTDEERLKRLNLLQADPASGTPRVLKSTKIANYHMLFSIDLKELEKAIDKIIEGIQANLNVLRRISKNKNRTNFFSIEIDVDAKDWNNYIRRLRYKKKNLTKQLIRQAPKFTKIILENVQRRYLEFEKKDGTPIGRTGLLERIMSDSSKMVKLVPKKTRLDILIMDSAYLTRATRIPPELPEAVLGLPYYALQDKYIVPYGPRYQRNFITTEEDELHQEDIEIFKELYTKVLANLATEVFAYSFKTPYMSSMPDPGGGAWGRDDVPF